MYAQSVLNVRFSLLDGYLMVLCCADRAHSSRDAATYGVSQLKGVEQPLGIKPVRAGRKERTRTTSFIFFAANQVKVMT